MPHINHSEFVNRFPALILSSRDFPKKPQDINILFISAVLGLEEGKIYTEKEINAELQNWMQAFGENIPLDHVTLRRYLVDSGYLLRDQDGSSYSLGSVVEYTFDPSLKDLDLVSLVEQQIKEREERKMMFMKAKEKSQGK